MKEIKRLEDAATLIEGEEFLVKSLIDVPVKFIGIQEEKVIGGRIWEDKGEEVVKICSYMEGSSWNLLTMASYEDIRKGEKNYDKFSAFLK